MNTQPGFFTIAKSNQSYFPETQSNDVIIGIKDNQQKILFGVADAPSMMQITNSNITIGGQFKADGVAVGGQIIGTGTNVIFSSIDHGWQVTNNEDIGLGIGNNRVQINNSFLQWGNMAKLVAQCNWVYDGTTNSNIFFNYTTLTATEEQYQKNSINVNGKAVSFDFTLQDDEQTINLTGPGGVFTFGFDALNSTVSNYVENINVRCYYRKTNMTPSFANYYMLKGSQWITTSLPHYGGLKLIYKAEDNNGNTFTMGSNVSFSITRVSVNEMS
jgi:hypothetical protein